VVTSAKTSAVLELLVTVERDSGFPLHHQLEQQLREAIREGRLGGGATMPSTRALASQLAVARGVVVEAYEQLVAEGYLVSRPGGSTRVAELPNRIPPDEGAGRSDVAGGFIDLRPGRPDVTEFPRAAWARAARRVINEVPADRLTYLGGAGVLELREALAAYLARARGACAYTDHIIIATGFMQSLHLLARALTDTGARRIAVEDPYQPLYRAALGAGGLEVVPIPVDEDGLQFEPLARSRADAVVVTPAHQFPTGAVLAPERRSALLAWARERDRLIIEDDYDAEFRYDRDPVGAMQGLDPEHVVYAGTASKSIAPGIRLGWLLCPPRLTTALVEAKNAIDHGSSAIDQLLLADVIHHGELDRHLRRMRGVYRGRRDAMLAAIGRHLPSWRTIGASAGLHVVALSPRPLDEERLAEAALEAGVIIEVLAHYRAFDGPSGIAFGYAAHEGRRLDEGVHRLSLLVDAQDR
jgi:GntR family transcriptional regulator/MocR family aminotransferase